MKTMIYIFILICAGALVLLPSCELFNEPEAKINKEQLEVDVNDVLLGFNDMLSMKVNSVTGNTVYLDVFTAMVFSDETKDSYKELGDSVMRQVILRADPGQNLDKEVGKSQYSYVVRVFTSGNELKVKGGKKRYETSIDWDCTLC